MSWIQTHVLKDSLNWCETKLIWVVSTEAFNLHVAMALLRAGWLYKEKSGTSFKSFLYLEHNGLTNIELPLEQRAGQHFLKFPFVKFGTWGVGMGRFYLIYFCVVGWGLSEGCHWSAF